MDKQLLKDTVVWGSVLWFIGYILGIFLFAFVPVSLIGWVIMPIGLVTTLLILTKKINRHELSHFVKIAVIWTGIAILFDYVFLVALFKPADGYYKLDVYLYYILTFCLPLIVGWIKSHRVKLPI